MKTIIMPRYVGTRFTHAVLQVLASDHGIDLLHIKGPAVDDRLLAVGPPGDPPSSTPRPIPRQSVDADVLVRPAHVARLFEVMHRHGWVTAYDFADGSAFEHAATFTHPFLSPADVHRQFPGIEADASTAFERLWRERRTALVAGIPCLVPSLTAQRLLLIVHAARGGALQHSDILRSWTEATEEARDEVQHLARALGAEVALAAGTGRLDEYEGRRGYELWRALSTGERSRVRLWLARVKSEPTTSTKLRRAVRLVLPNRRRMHTVLGRRPTLAEVAGAYATRARAGLNEMARLVRSGRTEPGQRR
ncbi:nucleotidyltransferase family protein [Ornithinibacter aureus]|uniref:nucleotidyltransferase family protein n=1 Tax=Ornithinibacter aureus TaxID=622664 RepID=UPI001FE30065|nr:nucleotidyltransferase family protein [Ornithinibacter aureus]KAF0832327.1 putative nucleotidyltransferase-like protein [Ornithinibacter aureus]